MCIFLTPALKDIVMAPKSQTKQFFQPKTWEFLKPLSIHLWGGRGQTGEER